MKWRWALDWIDAVGILLTLYLLVGCLMLLGVERVEVQLSTLAGALLLFPILRRKVFRIPFRDAGRTASGLGTLATMLIVFGGLVSAGAALVTVVLARPVHSPATARIPPTGVSIERMDASAEEKAHAAAERERELQRLEEEMREEGLARDAAATRKSREQVPVALLVGLVGLVAVVAGGMLDRKVTASPARRS